MKQLLTALILTAAALATPSAFAWGAYATDGEHGYGYSVDESTELAARNLAISRCLTAAGRGADSISACTNSVETFTDRCSGLIFDERDAEYNFYWRRSIDGSIMTDAEPTDHQTLAALLSFWLSHSSPGSTTLNIQIDGTDIPTESICDNTCDVEREIVELDTNKSGCRAKTKDDCGETEIFVDDICRERISDDCSATEEFVEDTKTCRAKTSDDCSITEEFESGNCRPRDEDDCDGETPVFNNGLCVAATPTSGGGGSSSSNVGLIVGGVVVAGLALWYFTSGSDDLSWTPSYAFQNNNGILSYSVGSRWTATANDWDLYWQTRQNGDKFVYGSGIRYNGNILSAAMNSKSEGKQTDLDLALSANKTVGLWNFGGGYQFDMQLSDDATESQNRLNAKVRYTVDKWILSANANTDGKTTRAAVNYSYRF